MLTPILIEALKLRRSLALVLALAAPMLIAVFIFFNLLRLEGAQPWDMWMLSAAGIWAFFMLPMGVTALTALVAHQEHSVRAWDHLRALPVPRWRLYAAKAVCVLAVVAVMSALVLGLVWVAVTLGGWVRPDLAATGDFNAPHYGGVLTRMLLAGLLLIALQFWTALRFHSFVPGLALGIGGTFFAVVATAARQGVFLPWQMPVNMLATEAWRVQTALMLGSVGGAVVLALAIVHLSRREAS